MSYRSCFFCIFGMFYLNCGFFSTLPPASSNLCSFIQFYLCLYCALPISAAFGSFSFCAEVISMVQSALLVILGYSTIGNWKVLDWTRILSRSPITGNSLRLVVGGRPVFHSVPLEACFAMSFTVSFCFSWDCYCFSIVDELYAVRSYDVQLYITTLHWLCWCLYFVTAFFPQVPLAHIHAVLFIIALCQHRSMLTFSIAIFRAQNTWFYALCLDYYSIHNHKHTQLFMLYWRNIQFKNYYFIGEINNLAQ